MAKNKILGAVADLLQRVGTRGKAQAGGKAKADDPLYTHREEAAVEFETSTGTLRIADFTPDGQPVILFPHDTASQAVVDYLAGCPEGIAGLILPAPEEPRPEEPKPEEPKPEEPKPEEPAPEEPKQ